MGIRVPDAQYQAPTPEPEQAQVPQAKLPTANANDFGAAQAAAGVEAGAKVADATGKLADDLIQQKSWSQTSQVFENRELLNEHADKLMNDTDTFDFKKADGTVVQIPKGYGLRPSFAAVSPDDFKAQMQAYQNSLSPDGKGGGWLNSVAKMNQRYTDEPISSNYGKLSTYNRDQVTKETAATNALALEKATGNSVDQPTMSKAIHYVSEVSTFQQAHGQISPKDQIDNNQKLFSNVMNMYAENNIGKVSADDLKKQVDDSMASSGGLITPAMKTAMYDKIDKLNDAYHKQEKVNQENAHGDALGEKSAGIMSGKYNPTNANAILLDKNLTVAESTAMYNAVMNVNAQKEEGNATLTSLVNRNSIVPVNEKNLGIATKGKGNEENAKAYSDASTIVNSLSKQDAAYKFVSAISNDKLTKSQLDVYSGMLALVSQYLPTKTEQQQDGKEIDPKGVPVVSGLKAMAEFAKGKPGGTGLMKNYLDGVQAPNADPNQAKDAAIKTWRLDQYPMTSGNDNITHVIDNNSPTVRVNPRTMSNGKQAIVYPAARINEKKKQSLTAPLEA